MTLILAAIKPQFAVVAADGNVLKYVPGTEAFVSDSNCRKIFPLPGRSIVLAVHGANRLHTCPGDGFPIVRAIEELQAELIAIPQFRSVVDHLREALTPPIELTRAILTREGVQCDPIKIACIGFDRNGDRCQAFEIHWNKPSDGGGSLLTEYDPVECRIYYGGTGERTAKSVINRRGDGRHLDAIKHYSLREMTNYVKELYDESFSSQESMDFGGEYHSVSVNAKGWRWQHSPQGGFAVE